MSKTSVLTQIPDNKSFLQPTKYVFEPTTLPFLRYFVQSVTLPAVSTTAPIQPAMGFTDIKRHGDKLKFDQLVISAIIDEDMRVWEETFSWLNALTAPDRFEQYAKFFDRKANPYHDSILTINTNSNIPNIRFKFTNCHPVNLGAVHFAETQNADIILVADIVFEYDQYYIQRIKSES
jgi:hypothetical protein